MGLDGWIALLTAGHREVSGPAYRRAVFSSNSTVCGPVDGAINPAGEAIVAAGIYDAVTAGTLLATFEQRHVGLTVPCDWPNQVLVVNLALPLVHAINATAQGIDQSPPIRIRPGELCGSINGAALYAATSLTVRGGQIVAL